jgi:hypothetical protein
MEERPEDIVMQTTPAHPSSAAAAKTSWNAPSAGDDVSGSVSEFRASF